MLKMKLLQNNLLNFSLAIPNDESNEKENADYNFNIKEIEMLMNEAFEVVEVSV